MISFNRYIAILLCSTICLLVGAASINYFVNPFELFNVQRSSFNAIKAESVERVRLFKKYQPVYQSPSLLLVGNSRVEMGIDPSHELIVKQGLKAYNMGLPGLSLSQQLNYANNVITQGDVEVLFLGIDFLDFLTTPQQKNVKESTTKFDGTEDKFSALFSFDALIASIMTVMNQNAFAANRLTNGFNPANNYIPIIKHEGQDVLFKQKLQQLNQQLANRQWDQSRMLADDSSTLNRLIVETSRWQQQGKRVYVFINPYHQDYYATIEQNGLSQQFADWRRTMSVQLSASSIFCDFTGLGKQYSLVKKNEKELEYFWEPAHYKKELGDILVNQLFNGCR